MKRTTYLNTFLSLLATSTAVTVHDSIRDITYHGTTRTVANTTIASFQNIPFAESVAGVKRFTRPVAKISPPGAVIDATKPGPACPQQRVPFEAFPFFSNVTDVSEDCLSLRVDRLGEQDTHGRKLPVMVFIYGGGDVIGQAYDRLYTPDGLLLGAASKGTPLIYVAMNYRLNLFGFASSEAIKSENNGNAGLLDQRLALEWVQKNIAAFGGDPENVTIFGESDGATGVGLQLTAYGGKGKAPFRRAIMESGGPSADAGVASNFSAVATQAVAQKVGCDKKTSAETLTCLRNVPFQELLNATLTYEFEAAPGSGFDTFIATAGDSFLPAAPSELIRTGQFYKDVSVISGWNLNDASIFTDPSISSIEDMTKFLRVSIPKVRDSTIEKLLSLYPAEEFQAANNRSASFYRASRIFRDATYVCPGLFTAKAVEHFSRASAFAYQLDQTPFAALLQELGQGSSGVPHFSDIFYVFNAVSSLTDYGATASDAEIGSAMSGSWAAFATTGHPGNRKQRKGSFGQWPRAVWGAWEAEVCANDEFNVFAIGGARTGNVVVRRDTKAVGLDRLVERCAYMTTPQFFAELAT